MLVLGGDGFCGWPSALRLSEAGHDVAVVDNLSRRRIDNELETGSLTPITPMGTRLATWRALTGRSIAFHALDVAQDYDRLLALIDQSRPDAIVHFAEQRSAPYSMKSARHKRYTILNNVGATNSLLAAVVESGQDVHVVHLGTMGVYGYGTPGHRIPEGYLPVRVGGDAAEREILYPASPGSIYHLTKAQDQLMFAFYNKNDRLRVTDLHQGIVWGTQTPETERHPRLINRFDYDGDYGTVLNRFLMQAAVGHPLTVYGTGGQTRAFIHIRDAVRCVQLAVENPPSSGERVRIFNQMTETHRVRDLAMLVSSMTGVPINYMENPRNELSENTLSASNDHLLGLGLDPITLDRGLLLEITDVARRYAERCDLEKIICRSSWTAAAGAGRAAVT